MWQLRPPRDPPPLHGKCHLKFPFWLPAHLPNILNIRFQTLDAFIHWYCVMLLWKLVIPWYGPIAHKVPSALFGLRKRICQRSTALFSFLGKRICQSNIFSLDIFTLLVLFALLCLFFCVPIPLFMAIYERNGIQFIDSNGIANYRQWRWSISWDQSKSISLTNDISNSWAASKHSSLIFSWDVGNTRLSVFFSGQQPNTVFPLFSDVKKFKFLLI